MRDEHAHMTDNTHKEGDARRRSTALAAKEKPQHDTQPTRQHPAARHTRTCEPTKRCGARGYGEKHQPTASRYATPVSVALRKTREHSRPHDNAQHLT